MALSEAASQLPQLSLHSLSVLVPLGALVLQAMVELDLVLTYCVFHDGLQRRHLLLPLAADLIDGFLFGVLRHGGHRPDVLHVRASLFQLSLQGADLNLSAVQNQRLLLQLRFLGVEELFELGSLLVEHGLLLLLHFDELGSLLLQSLHSLLEHLVMLGRQRGSRGLIGHGFLRGA